MGLSGGALGEVTLFSSEELGDSQPQVLERTLSPEHRGVDVTSLQVSWTDELHQRQHAPLIVCVEDPADLLPPGSLVGLNLDALIDCLISFRSLAEEVDRRSRVAAKSRSDAATDSLQAVDTSGYLLYRVRRFVRAAAGMCERLQRTPPVLQATEYRLGSASAPSWDICGSVRAPQESLLKNAKLPHGLSRKRRRQQPACKHGLLP
jgi:hypothetical protein